MVLVSLACTFDSTSNRTTETLPEDNQITLAPTDSVALTPLIEPTEQAQITEAAVAPAIENGRPLAARVNNQPIYLDVYEAQIAQIEQALNRQQTTGEIDPTARLTELRQQALDGLIEQEIIEQQAEALGITVSPAEVEVEAEKIIAEMDEMELPTQFERWLEGNGLTEATFLSSLQSQLIANRLFEQVTQNEPDQEQKNLVFNEWFSEKRAEAIIEKYVAP